MSSGVVSDSRFITRQPARLIAGQFRQLFFPLRWGVAVCDKRSTREHAWSERERERAEVRKDDVRRGGPIREGERGPLIKGFLFFKKKKLNGKFPNCPQKAMVFTTHIIYF